MQRERDAQVAADGGVAAGVTTPAVDAVMLNPQGAGQMLIFPHFMVNAGHAALLSIVNPTSRGKALKLRFHEAHESGAVLAGSPLVGFLAVNYVNAKVTSGVLSNYIAASPHHSSASRAFHRSTECLPVTE